MTDLGAALANTTQFSVEEARHARNLNGIQKSLKPYNGVSDAQREKIHNTAKDFEAMMMSQMLGYMFTDLDPHGPFGGGRGEEIFRSFLVDEYGQGLSATNTIGITEQVERHLLILQEQKRADSNMIHPSQAYNSSQ